MSKFLCGLFAAVVLFVHPARAGAEPVMETPARHAVLVDLASDTVLFEKAADDPMPPASMSKLMTAYMLFERLNQGRLSLDDTFPVSEKAWRMGGSKMFVEVNTRVKIEDLIRGIIVQSGNDACIVVAEGLFGTEEAFAAEATRRARALGLENTTIRNASGWPHPEHLTTARDLAQLAKRIIEDFPERYLYYSEKEFTYNGIRQGNRNPLLYRDMGVDGLKTGHTEESGYGLTASMERDGRRLVLVVNGLRNVNERSRETERLLEWGFREFGAYELFKAGETVEAAPAWLGASPTVPLVLEQDLAVSIRRHLRGDLKVEVSYPGPVPTPIAQGTPVGTVRVTAPGLPTVERTLVAGTDVDRLGMFGRLFSAMRYLVVGLDG
ncbi:MAG: D-alanyl-D-alanine carboxypeptidase family protein [Alphaproteobacteria bacterium]